jgi:hypothetical protein
VAVLCNVGSANPGMLGTRVAEIFLAGALKPTPTQASAVRLDAAQLARRAGIYRNARTNQAIEVVVRDSTLAVRGTRLVPISESVFSFASGRVEFLDATRARLIESADTTLLERQDRWAPTVRELSAFTGVYQSDEAETWFAVTVKDGALHATDRYGESQRLTPAYRDAFTSGGTLILFHRASSDAVTGASLGLGRVRDLRYVKK